MKPTPDQVIGFALVIAGLCFRAFTGIDADTGSIVIGGGLGMLAPGALRAAAGKTGGTP